MLYVAHRGLSSLFTHSGTSPATGGPPENRHKKDTRSALVDSCQHVGRGFQAFVMPLELEEVRQSATTAGLHDIYFNEASRVV